MTLEDDLRKSLRRAKKRQPDTVKLRAIRSLVNEWGIPLADMAKATGMSPETVRMIAAGEGPYKELPDLGPERVRWLAEWMRDFVETNGTDIPIAEIVRDALANVPRLVKLRDAGRRASAA